MQNESSDWSTMPPPSLPAFMAPDNNRAHSDLAANSLASLGLFWADHHVRAMLAAKSERRQRMAMPTKCMLLYILCSRVSASLFSSLRVCICSNTPCDSSCNLLMALPNARCQSLCFASFCRSAQLTCQMDCTQTVRPASRMMERIFLSDTSCCHSVV